MIVAVGVGVPVGVGVSATSGYFMGSSLEPPEQLMATASTRANRTAAVDLRIRDRSSGHL